MYYEEFVKSFIFHEDQKEYRKWFLVKIEIITKYCQIFRLFEITFQSKVKVIKNSKPYLLCLLPKTEWQLSFKRIKLSEIPGQMIKA